MSRNGSGVYSLPAGNPVVTGTTISSSWANTTLSDIATALTGSVAADGQTAMTGNLQMGNNKITGLAVATASGDALSYGQAATISALTVSGAFAANGGATLGDASGDALTINSSAVSIPNGLNFDSNTLVIDATNNRVGVGTASPTYLLDVLASGATSATNSFSVARITGASSVANDLTLIGPNTSQVRIKFGDTDNAGIGEVGYNHSTNAMRFVTNDSEKMVIDSSGNVGIGVTPSAWNTFDVIESGFAGNSFFGQAGAAQVGVGFNSYYSSGWKYANAGTAATLYYQLAGVHTFVGTNVTGSAGSAISYSQLLAFSNTKTVALEGATSQTGTGITFPATQSASTDANTLDDYEEGTWTPTIATTGTQPTVSAYNSRGGSYTKIGNIVTCSCNIRATLSSAGTGTPFISGLPFANASFLDGVALGLTDLLLPIPNVQWVDVTNVYFSSTWRTGVLNYCTFTVTYRVS